ncbi:hypothetical protein [Ancylobacter oerskovii]|uniref:Glycosyl transferase family 25 n=1 Tax=Ancylobacter oerskovii TaxID=459519 RepID=A0ABW4YZR3_9HYPH|nr:hypothetical protein [Ancylobacter oerskovii]MBS7541563.1 hypothetical protein [Ancylobacter oerskovii]
MDMTTFNIDRLLFINLDHRIDRRDHIERVLSPCRWPAERISAVRLLSPELAAEESAPSLNALSIWKSHRKALAHGLERLADGGLIVIEDDIAINRDFFRDTLSLPASLPGDWEILLFNTRFRKRSIVSNGIKIRQRWEKNAFRAAPAYLPAIKKTYICNGAHFCVFRDRGTIEKIIGAMDAAPAKCHIDSFFGHNFRTYALHSRSIGFADFESDNRLAGLPAVRPEVAGHSAPVQPAF